MAAVPSHSVASGTSTASPYDGHGVGDGLRRIVVQCRKRTEGNGQRAERGDPQHAAERYLRAEHEAVEGDEHRPAAGTLGDVHRAHRCTT